MMSCFTLTTVIAVIGYSYAVSASSILMITMGGTKSHKIPFASLGKGLINKGHNVTLLSGFPNENVPSLSLIEEITPIGFVLYVKKFTDWDILGPKLNGEEPVPIIDIFKYGYQACEALLSDPETENLLTRKFDLLILDGAYPECALGLVQHFGVPFMYINTVGFYTQTLSMAGNPSFYSVTPYLGLPFSNSMSLIERIRNTFWHLTLAVIHFIMVRGFLESVLRNHLGAAITPPYILSRNVSFILQNGHATLTYPRPYLPNVAEVACMHCTMARMLPQELDNFVRGGNKNGFVFVSMGSSVRAANMPKYLRRIFIKVFSKLPYQVVWKYEDDPNTIPDLPNNTFVGKWLPQQDLLGHENIVAFVNHGGLFSLSEAVYHGVPVVALPVFCDHESNSVKAERDGYAIRLDLKDITSELLLSVIARIISDPRFKETAVQRSILLRDQKETPLERAIFWTEYVLRHNGATHLQSPAKDLSFVQYFSIDVICVFLLTLYITSKLIKLFIYLCFINQSLKRNKMKIE